MTEKRGIKPSAIMRIGDMEQIVTLKLTVRDKHGKIVQEYRERPE